MRIDATSFGTITVDGRKYGHDIIFDDSGTVHKRSKSRSGRIGGHRELAEVEIAEMLERDPEVLVLGTGQHGRLPLSESTKRYLMQEVESRGLELVMGSTPGIQPQVNQILQSGKRVSGLMHITC